MTSPGGALRTLAGAGIVLRAFADSDIAGLVDLFADPEVTRWNPGPEVVPVSVEFEVAVPRLMPALR